MKPLGILLSCFDFSPVAEDEFHAWYDTEHIPERERVPGFLQCRRWLDTGGRRISAATYDLQSIDVLRSPGYLAIGYENNSPWTRRVGWRCVSLLRIEGEFVAGQAAPHGAEDGALLICAANVEPGFEAELAEGFRNDASGVTAVAGVHDVRLFRAVTGTRTHVVLYRLRSPAVVESSDWIAAGEPWIERMLAHASEPLRFLCRRYAREHAKYVKEIA